MSDLVERLREAGKEASLRGELTWEAADRIGQLERELVEMNDMLERQVNKNAAASFELAAERARLSDDDEYQGYSAVNVEGQLYVHTKAHDDAWQACKAERALADQLAQELEYDCTTFNGQAALAAYRKARGL